MRIISGKYKGRKINGFDIKGTRPTMDRVKESIFGCIQNDIKDSIVLDLFSGSGSLGLEAISNGAKQAYLIDNNDIAIKTIRDNSKDMDSVYIIQDDYKTYLKCTSLKFDIIFLDPPYHLELINDCLDVIKTRKLLNKKGIIVCEYEQENIKEIFEIKKRKRYGKTNVIIFQNNI